MEEKLRAIIEEMIRSLSEIERDCSRYYSHSDLNDVRSDIASVIDTAERDLSLAELQDIMEREKRASARQ